MSANVRRFIPNIEKGEKWTSFESVEEDNHRENSSQNQEKQKRGLIFGGWKRKMKRKTHPKIEKPEKWLNYLSVEEDSERENSSQIQEIEKMA